MTFGRIEWKLITNWKTFEKSGNPVLKVVVHKAAIKTKADNFSYGLAVSLDTRARAYVTDLNSILEDQICYRFSTFCKKNIHIFSSIIKSFQAESFWTSHQYFVLKQIMGWNNFCRSIVFSTSYRYIKISGTPDKCGTIELYVIQKGWKIRENTD